MDEHILLDSEYLERISRNKINKKINNPLSRSDDANIENHTINANDDSQVDLIETVVEHGVNDDDVMCESEKNKGKETEIGRLRLKIPDCSICREYLTRNLTIITVCGHVFHKECIDSWLLKFSSAKGSSSSSSLNGVGRLGYLENDNAEPTCPLCRVPCSALTLCDIVNITIDETLVLDEDSYMTTIKDENKNGETKSALSGECNLMSCKLKLKSISDELLTHIKDKEALKAQLKEADASLSLSKEVVESLERKNEVLRGDLNKITHELGELSQKHLEINRKYTHLQSNIAVSRFLNEDYQDNFQAKEEDVIQLSNILGFNPFESDDSNKSNDDSFEALKILSKAFIKLTERYSQLKEKSSQWKAKCYQLRDSNTIAINECISLKQKLVNIKKNEKASLCIGKKDDSKNFFNNKEDSILNIQDYEMSFTSISKQIQNRKTSNSKQNVATCSASIKETPCVMASTKVNSKESEEAYTQGNLHTSDKSEETSENNKAANEESPTPKYSSLLDFRKGGQKRRVIQKNPQSISSFFSTRKLKFNVINSTNHN